MFSRLFCSTFFGQVLSVGSGIALLNSPPKFHFFSLSRYLFHPRVPLNVQFSVKLKCPCGVLFSLSTKQRYLCLEGMSCSWIQTLNPSSLQDSPVGSCFTIHATASLLQMLSWSQDSLNLPPGCSENVDAHKVIQAQMQSHGVCRVDLRVNLSHMHV